MEEATANARRADLRFLLPVRPSRAAVLVEEAGLAEAWAAAGVETGGPAPDVVVTDRRHLDEALRLAADSVIVLGAASRRTLRRHGYRRATYVVRRGASGPRLVVPTRSPGGIRYLAARTSGGGRLARLRRAAGRRVLRLGLVPPRQRVTVASRLPGPPFVLGAAVAAGLVDDPASWALVLGEGDVLQRAVFLVTDRRGVPVRAVKFGRTGATASALDRDADGLALVAAAGPAAARAPRLLGAVPGAGVPVAVETAAPGATLTGFLMSDAAVVAKREVIDAVAAWALDLGVATRTDPGSLATERARLASSVVPQWSSLGAGAHLVDRIAGVPGVLAHHDLGTWNILHAGGERFTVVDWESARRPALPLWDLAYFLVDALTVEQGPASKDVKARRALAVLDGSDPRSEVLLGWLRRAAAALDLEEATVGPLLTLCWMHHGLSPGQRAGAGGDAPTSPGHLARLTGPWLADPRLGPAWPAWSGGR